MMYDEKKAELLKQQYPEGTRICLDHMEDLCPVERGTCGTVQFLDDAGTMHCKFDNGRTLGVIPDVDHFHADEGITGTREDKRDEFQRMIKDCRIGKIDRIYTKSISRFSRNTRDCLKNVRELKSLGITIYFEKENIDTANMTDEMMITIIGGLAQEESTSISQNMQWSIRKRMANGT